MTFEFATPLMVINSLSTPLLLTAFCGLEKQKIWGKTPVRRFGKAARRDDKWLWPNAVPETYGGSPVL